MARSPLDQYQSTRPITGMQRDTTPMSSPQNATRFVLNGALENDEGNFGAIMSAMGNKAIGMLPAGQQLIGNIQLGRDRTVIFSTGGTDRIDIIDRSGSLETLVEADLGFSVDYPIRGLYRTLRGKETVIYFNDHHNPDRRINIDKLDRYKNISGDWNVEEFQLQSRMLPPVIEEVTVQDFGGQMKSGSFQFAVEVLDETLNRVSISLLSPSVSVYADSISQSAHSITGSFNIEDGKSAAVGGRPRTNKSVDIRISGLPEQYPYFRIYIVRASSHNGETLEAFRSSQIYNISSSSMNVQWPGEDQDSTLSTVEDVVIGMPDYVSSLQMQEVENHLVRINIKGTYRDWRAFQQAANDISIKWKADYIHPYDQYAPGNPRYPDNGALGYQPDEVYALAIVYVFTDGTLSPAFHIPGRIKTGADVGSSPVQPGPDTAHLPPKAGYARWEVYNTAGTGGQMAYWEHPSARYPNDPAIWGPASPPGLSNQPVRHHRFPDHSVVPLRKLQTGPSGRQVWHYLRLGIVEENVTYPDSDIIGHYIVRAERNELTATVVDGVNLMYEDTTFNTLEKNNLTGINTNLSNVYFGVTDLPVKARPDTSDSAVVFSPMMQSGMGSLQPATYLSIQYVLGMREADYRAHNYISEGLRGYPGSNPDFIRFWGASFHEANADNANLYDLQANREIKGSVVVGPDAQSTTSLIDYSVYNANYLDRTAVMQFEDDLPDTSQAGNDANYRMVYAYAKRGIAPYGNVTQLVYKRTHTALRTPVNTNAVYGGDCFNNLWDYHFLGCSKFLTETPGQVGQDTRVDFMVASILQMQGESMVNLSLRVQGEGTGFTIPLHGKQVTMDTAEKDNAQSEQVRYFNWFLERGFDPDATSPDWIPRDSWYITYYGINEDYHRVLPERVYPALPITFDYDNESINDQPNYMVWSLSDRSEDLNDNWRVYRVADYKLIGEDTGPLTAFNYDRGKIWCTTTGSLYFLPTNRQNLQTDQDTVYLGTGNFLGIPAAKLSAMPQGFGGCQHPHSHVVTDMGWVYPDAEAGEVIHIGERPSKISDKGMRSWFRTHMPFTQDYGYSVIPNDANSMYGFYDARFKRCYLLKRESDPAGVRYGWMISYAFNHSCWESFHSWMPTQAFSIGHDLYSCEDTPVIYAHNQGESQRFYQEDFPFILEYVMPTPPTMEIQTLEMYMRMRGVAYPQEIFDEGLVYNSRQTTGVFQIDIMDKRTNPWRKRWSNHRKNIILSEHTHRISGIRDLSTGTPIMSSDWQHIQSYYRPGRNGYMDAVPVNVDYSRSQDRLPGLTDRYQIIRLIRNKRSSRQLIVELLASRTPQSIR